MRFLLRPGWIALTVAVLGFAAACYYLLAPWQFHRSDERAGNNAAIEAAVTTPPVPRGQLVAPGQPPAPQVHWRQVRVTGTYDPTGQVLVRLRSVDGGPAYEVMTPLRTTSGETVLIDRGYVQPGSAGAIPPIAAPPPGLVSVVGYQRPDEAGDARPTIDAGGHRQVYAADSRLVAAATGRTLSPGYVQLVAGQPGGLTPVPLPERDPNPSYSYAWQWLIFGVMALGAWAYFVRLEYRTRQGKRGLRDERERRANDPRDRPVTDPHDAPAPTSRGAEAAGAAAAGGPERSTAETLADRYGRR